MRERLIQLYPEVMKELNKGWMPNDSMFHAEVTSLLRLYRATNGILRGRTIRLKVDRRVCDSCEKVLPILRHELGDPKIILVDFFGLESQLGD
jgi:hypothetical protein